MCRRLCTEPVKEIMKDSRQRKRVGEGLGTGDTGDLKVNPSEVDLRVLES